MQLTENHYTDLKKNIKRGTDYIFRIGGEEFTIIITNENLENLINITKILQREIKKLAIKPTFILPYQ